MKTLNDPAYFFIGEHEVSLHRKDNYPIFKINLYGELLDQGPLDTVYVKFLGHSKLKFNKYEKAIRSIIRDHASYALAFQCECLTLVEKVNTFSLKTQK